MRRSMGGRGAIDRAVAVWALFAVLFAVTAGRAWADEPASCGAPCPSELEPLLPVPEFGGCWYRRPVLTGAWHGTRSRWAEKGVFLDIQWTQVSQGVLDGGFRERWVHTTNLDLRATFDLARMRVVPGALVSARAQSRFGDSVNADSGLILPVHTYGYFPYTDAVDEDVPIAITELNWTQMVSEKLGFLFEE